ncbi:DUF6920 family protein [Isachenkonia alkalipeptolytica]|uniref:Uncharacterized protein n=1 Tax=Isachenkonia alkalipeptolytica TaxID=2565777 RepID=A0AA44BDE8_9CLOT|nr:DUF6544 family protein [Isachenkonia alkalipeptolytica]NBG87838.1 hypothetical protein [Isachenkonia alkalipeptolytica]
MGIKDFFVQYWWLVLLGMVVVIILSFIGGSFLMSNRISKEIDQLMSMDSKKEVRDESRITQEDLEGLPEPVKRWLLSVGVVGKKKVRSVEFSQRGDMKLEPDQKHWLEAKAKQYIRVDQPGFLWHVDLPMIPLINTKGRDLFYEGNSLMEVRIGSLIPVVNAKDSKKLDESALHRFLLEIPLYPTAALEDYMTWEAIDQESAKGILTYKNMTVAADFYFQEDGTLEMMESLRYKDHDEQAKRIPCIGRINDHKEYNGIKIPTKVEITWVMDDIPFTWYKLENYDVKFED